MTPKWKDYRSLCKNFKFLVYTLHVSKLAILYIIESSFVDGLQASTTLENDIACIMWLT